MRVDFIVGARPNFMKLAPVIRALEANQGSQLSWRVVHTGQHYDRGMSEVFFSQLNIPLPDFNLGVGSGSHARQTGAIMNAYEDLLLTRPTDYCMVIGDVNSTIAGALVAKKLGIRVGHIEGGLRSLDMTMPEEVNRIATDAICDDYFVTSEAARSNLLREGHSDSSIHFVGNTMIDSLIANMEKIEAPGGEYFSGEEYVLVTIHRPSNVDNPERLKKILDTLEMAAGERKILFPVHPRTAQVLQKIGSLGDSFVLLPPQPYLQFIYLLKHCDVVVSDSGGVSEEATYLGKRCITLRDSTERPETVDSGLNILVGDNMDQLRYHLDKQVMPSDGPYTTPEKWDGYAGERIVKALSLIATLTSPDKSW